MKIRISVVREVVERIQIKVKIQRSKATECWVSRKEGHQWLPRKKHYTFNASTFMKTDGPKRNYSIINVK